MSKRDRMSLYLTLMKERTQWLKGWLASEEIRARCRAEPWADMCSHATPDADDIARADAEARAQP